MFITPGCRNDKPGMKGSQGQVNQVDRSGIKQGLWKTYTDSVLISEGSYTDGKADGTWTYWYDNGQKKEEGYYDMGSKESMWVEWYRDGTVMWKGEWEKGERQVGYPDAIAEIKFIGQDFPPDNILEHDSTYHLRIRILNIPVYHLFVEVDNGSITREGDSDQFVLHTSSEQNLTMVIGYMPDLEFRDFRNIAREIKFKIR